MKPFDRVVHELKTWPIYFEAILTEEKPFEARKDDRGFEVGHDLRLREWNPENSQYTGREIITGITYVLRGTEHVGRGYCVLGLSGGGRSQKSLSHRLSVTQAELEKFQSSHAEALIAIAAERTARATAERERDEHAAQRNRLTAIVAAYRAILTEYGAGWPGVDKFLAADNPCEGLTEALRTAHQALRAAKDAHEDLFAQCLSNPIKNAWGKDVDCTKINEMGQLAGAALAALATWVPDASPATDGKTGEGV